MIHDHDLQALREHRPFDEAESMHLARATACAMDPQSRPLEHFTASALVLDSSGERALLLFHKKLQRWLQPGGHVEAFDASFLAAALREGLEETGLPALEAVLERLFDVDSHPIPARENEPAHTHHDMRFLMRLPDSVDEAQATISAESLGLKWEPLAELAALSDPSISRMARKALAMSARPSSPRP